MAVNVKMGVDLGSFKSGITEAKNEVKTLDANMKLIDATFKATGNAEQALAQKMQTLNSKMTAQSNMAKQYEAALKQMTAAGVDPASAAYQKMAQGLLQAQAGMMETQAALNGLDGSQQNAAKSADQLSASVNNIGKKLSLDQVISGIDRITNGLESAAKKAIQLGEHLWDNIMDSARLSDDILTQAGILDMTPEQYQQYKGVFDTIGEITISEWAAAKRKIQRAMNDPTSDQIDVLSALGFTSQVPGKNGGYEETVSILAENWEDMFWDAAQQLQSMVASGQLTQDLADTYGEALFGKKFSSLKNLIKLGKEGFQEALGEQATISDEALEKNAALNDKVIQLQESFKALEAEVTSGLAPALTDAANALNGLLNNLLDYLQKPEGQEMLEKLGTAVSGLFDDLGKIDPNDVVSGFVEVFTSVTSGIQWLVDNAETAKGILGTIVGAWGVLTIGENVLKIANLVNGIKGLTATDAAAAGAAAGSSWAGAFASAAMKAAPFLAFLYTLLNPSGTDGSGVSENGMVTQAAIDFWNNEPGQWQERLMAVGNRFGDLGRLTTDESTMNIILDPSLTDEQVFEKLEEIGVVPLDTELKLPEGEAEKITKEVGVVQIPAELVLSGGGVKPAYLPRNVGQPWREQANGIWAVPYDGYLTSLHKGERVMPAREVSSRSFSSNLYVENMNMGGGMSADALAATIAARNRRMMAGYGS